MANKNLDTRIINKHDTEENWSKANFIPKQGELIIYDKDDNYDIERFKIGDGTTSVNNLPFRSIDGGYDALTEIVPETTLNFTLRNLTLTNCPPIEVGKTYTVTFYHPDTDPIEYELVGKEASIGGTYRYIGNEAHTWGDTNTGEPFIIYSYENNTAIVTYIYISSSETLPCTYNIKIKAIAPIKIDEKYLDIKNTNIVNGSKTGSLRTVGSIKEGSGYKMGDYAFAEGYSTTASGSYSHAEGESTTASGDRSHAEGSSTKASGRSSHSEGIGTTASGLSSHTEGNNTTALGDCSHAEGSLTKASGSDSHAEGRYTKALGVYSHAEGWSTTASGESSHTEGYSTVAGQMGFKVTACEKSTDTTGIYTLNSITGLEVNQRYSVYLSSSKENCGMITAIDTTHKKITVNGYPDIALSTSSSSTANYITIVNKPQLGDIFISGNYSHAEGQGTVASGNYSHAEGSGTTALGDSSHAEGYNTTAGQRGFKVTACEKLTDTTGTYTLTSVNGLSVNLTYSVYLRTSKENCGKITAIDTTNKKITVNGYPDIALSTGSSSTANYLTIVGKPELGDIKISGDYSHAEGKNTTASDEASHAEGYGTKASGDYSHAEGESTTASGQGSHAEGAGTTASGSESHAEGSGTTASGGSAHTEGSFTTASGSSSHAEGNYTTASGLSSHAEGQDTIASGNHAHAEGQDTIASSNYQHVQGKYNIEDSNNIYADIIGNGDILFGTRSNAATVDWQGNAWYAGDVYVGSTSGTNRDEGSKKLATEEYVDTQITEKTDQTYSPTSENAQSGKAVAKAVSEVATKTENKTEHTPNYMPDSSTFIGAFIYKNAAGQVSIYSSTGNYLSPFIEIDESLIGKKITLQSQPLSDGNWGNLSRNTYIKSITAFSVNNEPDENGYFNTDYIINHSENITRNSDDGTYAVYTIPQGTKYLRISVGSAFVINPAYRSMFVINDDGSLLSDYVANESIVVEGKKELVADVLVNGSNLSDDAMDKINKEIVIEDITDDNLTQVSPKHKKSLRVSSLSQLFTSYEETNADYISVENTYLNTSAKVDWLYGLYDALMEAYPDYITRTQIATTAEPTLPVYKSDGTERTDITSESVFPMYRYDFKPPIAEHTSNVTAEYSKEVSLPKILYTTGIHGGEYRQVVAAYRFFKMLCEKWRDYELLSDLRWNCHFVVIPLTNPFGFNYPNNRYDSNGVVVSKRNEHNIDISGNFPSSSYQSGTDNVYGTTPLSEPESQALYNIIKNENFILGIDNHTFNYLAASGNTDKMAGYFIANHKHNNSTAFWFKISRWLNQRVRKLSPNIDSTYDSYDMAQIWGDSREQMLSNTFASVGGNVEMTLGIDPNATVGDDGVTPSMAEKTQAFCVDELAVIFYEALQDFYTY